MRKSSYLFALFMLAIFLPLVFYPLDAGASTTLIKNGAITYQPESNPNDDIKAIAPLKPGINRLLDYSQAYSIDYPSHMNIDASLSQVKTSLWDDKTCIEVYRDDFSQTVHTAAAYQYYSNQFLNNRKDHQIQENRSITIAGIKAHLLRWQRSKLSRVAGDKNYYMSVEIPRNSKEVYTIVIKSSSPVESFLPLVKSFTFIDKKGYSQINTRFKKNDKAWNEETKAFYEQYFGPDASLHWGIFENSAPASMDYLNKLEENLDYSFEFLVLYKTFDTPFPLEELQKAYEEQKYVELTLQTMWYNRDNSSVTYDILNGHYDYFFEDYAEKARQFGHPILFRLNNEMNGDWCVYSSYYSSKDSELFKEVWRYIYNIFQQKQVDNVIWVWNPHDLSFPGFMWNHYLNYFPGEEYVDIIGLTGYNTGTYHKGEIWRGFRQIYDPLYEEYCRYFDYPFMISEFACSSVGGNKALWIEEMFAQMGKYDRIKVAIWFNGVDFDLVGRAARKYRLDESPAIIEAFQKGLQSYSFDPKANKTRQ